MKCKKTQTTEGLVAVVHPRLVRLFRSAADVTNIAARVCLRQITRCLCFLLLPLYLREVWRFDDRENLRDVRFYFRESLVIIRRYWKARFVTVKCWLAFFRVAHRFGWEFAMSRVKLAGVGFRFWPNVDVGTRASARCRPTPCSESPDPSNTVSPPALGAEIYPPTQTARS